MIAIRAEIGRIERGEWTHDASPLAGAPHTAEDLLAETWDRPYSRADGRGARSASERQVLAAGEPHRRRVRRPQRRVLLRPDRGLRRTPRLRLVTRVAHPGVVQHRLLRRARGSTPMPRPARSMPATGSWPRSCTPIAPPTRSTGTVQAGGRRVLRAAGPRDPGRLRRVPGTGRRGIALRGAPPRAPHSGRPVPTISPPPGRPGAAHRCPTGCGRRIAAGLVALGVVVAVWALFGDLPSPQDADTPVAVQVTLLIMAAKLWAGALLVARYPQLRARWHR